MKRLLLTTLVLLLTAFCVCAAEAHLWTDTQGRTLKGEFVEATAKEVTVRRDDGTVVRIDRSLLSAEDLAYADKEQANRPIAVRIEVSRGKFSSQRSETTSRITTMEKWGYEIKVTNTTNLTGQNVRVEYRLFVRKAAAPGAKAPKDTSLTGKAGQHTVGSLNGRGVESFRTDTIDTKVIELQPGYVWGETNNNDAVTDKLEGIWLRVYQNDKIIGEYLSADSLRKEGWDKAGQ